MSTKPCREHILCAYLFYYILHILYKKKKNQQIEIYHVYSLFLCYPKQIWWNSHTRVFVVHSCYKIARRAKIMADKINKALDDTFEAVPPTFLSLLFGLLMSYFGLFGFWNPISPSGG